MDKRIGHVANTAWAGDASDRVGDGGAMVLGIDVGGTATKMAVFSFGGELLGARSFPSRWMLPSGPLDGFASEIRVMLSDCAGFGVDRIAAVGLAVPGAVSDGGVLELCPNIDLDLGLCVSRLRTLLPHACVTVLNDADAAVLGDWWRGTSHDRRCESVVLVTLGTGVGAGIVSGGRLLSGVHGAAGEVGHLCVDLSEEARCSCGKAGCLEQYASAAGLVRQARAALLSARPDATFDQAVAAFFDARAVLAAAERRDPHALAALERFSGALGFGLAQMACLTDPDVFVLGGGLSERADLFIHAVSSRYRLCAVSVYRDTPIVASSLGNKCGVYGAAYRALQELKGKEALRCGRQRAAPAP